MLIIIKSSAVKRCRWGVDNSSRWWGFCHDGDQAGQEVAMVCML